MKKSLKKQAVFPVLMLLVVTALALIGSSFAWFSMNSVAHLSTVSGTVEDSSVGLMISVDGSTFKSSVNLATDSPVTFVNPFRFHQMSTINARTFYEATITQKDTSGIATKITSAASTHDPIAGNTPGTLVGWISNHAETPTTQPLAAGATSGQINSTTYNNEAGYMVFDLFFSVENDATLYLDNGTKFTQGTEQAPNAAFRVAFFDLGTAQTGSAAIALDYAENSAPTVIWDPANETSYYGLKAASDTEFDPYITSPNSQEVTTRTSAELFSNTNWSDTNKPSEYSATTIQSIASLAAGVTKVRVVVWLEGNDVSCVSKIANTAMSIKLDFYAEKD